MNNQFKLRYRPEIDGLRALAVLGVIFYHVEIFLFDKKILTGGFLGVDIFFVISGYLITFLIIKEYLEGLYWINEYYFNDRIANKWFYKNFKSPLLLDIDKFFDNNNFTFDYIEKKFK